MFKYNIIGVLLMCLVSLLPTPAYAHGKVDRVVVRKSEREMDLMSKNEIVRSYRISLGANPVGHKIQEGDERTPEGRYTIDYRNPKSRYHLALHISYPDAEDNKRAKAKHLRPGGMIMIHGSPNSWGWAESLLKASDWTNGCIAVSNAEIDEIWTLVKDGTPIVIQP
ncbi:MAG: L,D-transpeptidase family protein [Desulfatitalea sp.]